MRRFPATLIVLFFMLLAVFAASGPAMAAGKPIAIPSLDLVESKKYTRLVIDFTGSPERVSVNRGHRRLEIALGRCSVESSCNLRIVKGGVISSLSADNVGETLKLQINLIQDTEYQVYQLPKYLSRPDRVVVNFKNPTEEIDRIFKNLSENKRIVVIDPGHGGQDPGAVGRGGLEEKVVVLDVARRAADLISKSRNIECYLTRDSDTFLKLADRVAISKKYGADLFVSVHCNASTTSDAKGVEVFYLSDNKASDAAAKLLAQQENAALEIGIEPIDGGFDENVLKILIDMKQNFVLKQSSQFASLVLQRLSQKLSNIDRGVRRAGFAVLKAVVVPSVLLELAFISNPAEEKLLKSDWYRQATAECLAKAVADFFAMETTKDTQASKEPGLSHKGKR